MHCEDQPLLVRIQSELFLNGVNANAVDTLVLQQGELVVLLGRVGSGKSSVLKSMASRTNDAFSAPARIVRAGLAVTVTPAYRISSSRPVLDYLVRRSRARGAGLGLFLRRNRHCSAIVRRHLERVQLMHKADAQVTSLEAHERCRLALADALLCQPAVILADDTLAGLSPACADALLALFYRICKEDGITLIISLHQIRLAVLYADRIVGLVNGMVRFNGDPSGLTEEICSDLFAFGHARCHSYDRCLRLWKMRRLALQAEKECR